MHLIAGLVVPSLALLTSAVCAFESTTPANGKEKEFIVYDKEVVHYPFTVHLPDRKTRDLPALTGPPPLVLSLSGAGAKGSADDAAELSGYDGLSRRIMLYNNEDRSVPNTQAAEEFLTVTPIAPIEGSQEDAAWDPDALISVLTRAATMYEVDLSRVYLSTYGMGSKVAYTLLMDHPDIFAGAVISSGRLVATPEELQVLLGIPIRNYVGGADEPDMRTDAVGLAESYARAVAQAKGAGRVFNESRTFENILDIPGAEHLAMTMRPWDDDVITDGYAGASAWLLAQSRPELANIPGLENAGYSTLAAPAPAENVSSSVFSKAAESRFSRHVPFLAVLAVLVSFLLS